MGPDQYKTKGLAAFKGTALADLKRVVAGLQALGVFVVPLGEVEQWLSHLNSKTEKKGWIVRIFGALGTNPGSASDVRPASDDVWRFLDTIAKWVANPARLGMP